MRKYIPFDEVDQLASIEEVAEMLNLKVVKRRPHQFRCECPTCKGQDLAITPGVRSKRGMLGVWFCQNCQTGGDKIGLVAHVLKLDDQKEAAFFIAEQFGAGTVNSNTGTVTSTVSKSRANQPQNEQKAEPTASKFDPVKFASKLAFSEEVRALGFSQADAEHYGIGFYRGHTYLPLRHPSGAIAGWCAIIEGKLKLPPQWLPDTSNVVVLQPKKSA